MECVANGEPVSWLADQAQNKGSKHVHRVNEQRIDDQDMARFVERARHGADEGICKVHGGCDFLRGLDSSRVVKGQSQEGRALAVRRSDAKGDLNALRGQLFRQQLPGGPKQFLYIKRRALWRGQGAKVPVYLGET